MMMSIISLSESKTAPLASSGGVLVPTVQLNVLDWVPKSEFIYTCAPSSISIDLNNWQGVYELLGICFM
jgi:hypothetical protein